jgi:SAM-dependent methyltransferase
MSSTNPAETYERFMVPPLFAPAARRLLDLAKPRPGERVLDVGCGTGIVARQVAPHVGATGRVVGLDFAPPMLAVARTASQREGLAIEWREGRAEALPFADGGFDLVLCQFALMFFADRTTALTEMRRVLADGGRVALHVFQGIERHPFYQALDEAIERRLGASGVGHIFALGDGGDLCRQVASAGFRDVEIAPVSVTARFPDPELFLAGEIDVDTASIPAMQQLDAVARRDLTTAIRADMEGPLRDYTEGDHVVIPFHTYVARAYRRRRVDWLRPCRGRPAMDGHRCDGETETCVTAKEGGACAESSIRPVLPTAACTCPDGGE